MKLGPEDAYKDFWNDRDWFDNSEYLEESDIFDKTNKKVPSNSKTSRRTFQLLNSLDYGPSCIHTLKTMERLERRNVLRLLGQERKISGEEGYDTVY